MKKTSFMVLALMVGLFVPSFVRAQGTLFVSNLGQTPISSGLIGSDSWIGQQFFTGPNSSGYFLNSIQLLMNAASNSPSGFSVSLYSSTSLDEVPVDYLGGLAGPDPSAGSVFTFTSSVVTLSPSTQYYIVLTDAAPVAQGAYIWSEAQLSASNGWEIDGGYATSVDGSSWTRNGTRTSAFQMAIFATPVPEPSAGSLILLGSSLFLCARWRKRAAH